ncbi:hypothetical protein [Enterocloster asparagiformis]|uniref:hypothetical protein n=1 Tax=Enterocloster asparagiformis TaxID=333367 RepID=UPI002352BD4D|nr:hypothetical protein [Enterocloster asparagiformis]
MKNLQESAFTYFGILRALSAFRRMISYPVFYRFHPKNNAAAREMNFHNSSRSTAALMGVTF